MECITDGLKFLLILNFITLYLHPSVLQSGIIELVSDVYKWRKCDILVKGSHSITVCTALELLSATCVKESDEMLAVIAQY